ncbi:hypothetical protein CYMTET_12440 [Cymbomonas tetramitiformis]|uniref:Uncharacterized protein n=1 Tax=Cymbomonas tetramitiformis TaxID=36881 RepID=A0AAE0GKM4_9CHLO|nr:hypothetical protein CYMTET_12440 [Cymbomonas tetramitiformis]
MAFKTVEKVLPLVQWEKVILHRQKAKRYCFSTDASMGEGMRGVLDGRYFSVPWNCLLEQPQLPCYPFQKGVLEARTIGSQELVALWWVAVLGGERLVGLTAVPVYVATKDKVGAVPFSRGKLADVQRDFFIQRERLTLQRQGRDFPGAALGDDPAVAFLRALPGVFNQGADKLVQHLGVLQAECYAANTYASFSTAIRSLDEVLTAWVAHIVEHKELKAATATHYIGDCGARAVRA